MDKQYFTSDLANYNSILHHGFPQFQSETVVGERHSGKINGAAGNSESAIEKVPLFSPHYSY